MHKEWLDLDRPRLKEAETRIQVAQMEMIIEGSFRFVEGMFGMC